MFISPMLLHKIDKPFDNDDYVSEPKMDGFRLIYSYIEDKKLYTRHKTDVTTRFPELLRFRHSKGDCI
jgi:DNA ligase-1